MGDLVEYCPVVPVDTMGRAASKDDYTPMHKAADEGDLEAFRKAFTDEKRKTMLGRKQLYAFAKADGSPLPGKAYLTEKEATEKEVAKREAAARETAELGAAEREAAEVEAAARAAAAKDGADRAAAEKEAAEKEVLKGGPRAGGRREGGL